MNACACDQPGLRPVDEAIADLLAQVPTPPTAEWVALEQAQGRTLAEPVHALRPMPAWDNSAMDGYALRAADLQGAPGYLPLAGRIAAGDAAAARQAAAGHLYQAAARVGAAPQATCLEAKLAVGPAHEENDHG